MGENVVLVIFDTCDVMYSWFIFLLPPIVLNNLFGLSTVFLLYKYNNNCLVLSPTYLFEKDYNLRHFFKNSDSDFRDMYRMSGHSKSFGQTKSSGSDTEPKVYIKPRIITVLRSGTRPRKAVRVLLNNR